MQPSAVSPDFLCDVQPDRDRVFVRVAGELDLNAVPHVAATVDDLLAAGFGRVVIDLRGLSFMDSAGVHMLISAHRAAERRGSTIALVRGPRAVHRVFELTATDSLFTFEDAPADA